MLLKVPVGSSDEFGLPALMAHQGVPLGNPRLQTDAHGVVSVRLNTLKAVGSV